MRTLTRRHQALTAWTAICLVGAVLVEAIHGILGG